MVATNYVTRYCETKALPKADIPHLFMLSIVLRHLVPAVVIIDRGTAFTADMLQEVVR